MGMVNMENKYVEPNAKIDFKRQSSIICPHDVNDTGMQIDVIGAGATGSYVVLQLAKMGLTNIHVWDGDVVEGHNLPNQLYGVEDIGVPKVEALSKIIKRLTDIDIHVHNQFVCKDSEPLGDVVFLLTDSMESRREIYETCIKYNPSSKLCIETRLAATQGRIYAFNPLDTIEQEMWENTLYSDVEAEVSECGTTIVMGASSSMIASVAVWQFIKWFRLYYLNEIRHETDIPDEIKNPEFELFIYISPVFNILNFNDDSVSTDNVTETININ